jgi:hypothetical protein
VSVVEHRSCSTSEMFTLTGERKLNYIFSKFYKIFDIKYKITAYNEKNDHYFLTLITAG